MAENRVEVHHAYQGEPFTIVIGRDLQWLDNPTDQVKLYRYDAGQIADALLDSLPGGTVDQLLIELLTRQASRLGVPFRKDRPGRRRQ